jgi:thiol-disulfide isomerase/thioredoxin
MPVKRTAHRHKKTRGGRSRRHHHTVRNSKPAITVGLIYANWCTHCQHLKPEWKKMKKGMRGMNCHYLEVEDADPNKDRKIADVNSRLKGEKLVANGYPTIFRIKGGNLEYYQGERTAPALQQWFKGGSPPQQQEVNKVPTLMEQMFGGQKGGCDCGKDTGVFTTLK